MSDHPPHLIDVVAIQLACEQGREWMFDVAASDYGHWAPSREVWRTRARGILDALDREGALYRQAFTTRKDSERPSPAAR